MNKSLLLDGQTGSDKILEISQFSRIDMAKRKCVKMQDEQKQEQKLSKNSKEDKHDISCQTILHC